MIDPRILEHSDMGEDKLEVIQTCCNYAPKGIFLEVGTRRGGTALLAIRNPNCIFFYSIDPYLSFPDMQGNLIEMEKSWEEDAREVLSSTNKTFEMLIKTSKEVIESGVLDELKFSYVLLDGEHTDQTVSMEIEYFSKRMNEGGIIVLDNYDWLTLELSDWVSPRFDIRYKIF